MQYYNKSGQEERLVCYITSLLFNLILFPLVVRARIRTVAEKGLLHQVYSARCTLYIATNRVSHLLKFYVIDFCERL